MSNSANDQTKFTVDAAYEAVAPDDFAAMIEVDRYGSRSDAFDKIISATHDHFWDPMDTRYIDFSAPFDMEKEFLFDPEQNFELRTAIGPDIARLAALRSTPEQHLQLQALVDQLQQQTEWVERDRASLAFWRVMVTASENIAYQLAFNSMQVAWQQVQSALAPALAGELQDIAGYKRLVRAVARHNPEAARKAAQALVEQGSHSVIELIERMRAMGSP